MRQAIIRSTNLGRFAQADSIIPDGVQGMDRYAYVNNSPMNFVDPSGHSPACDDGDWDGCHSRGGGKSIGGLGNTGVKRDNCTYHLCSPGKNLYELGWENNSQAWSIWTNPNATYGHRFAAGAYMGAWDGAHIAGAVGGATLTAILARQAAVTTLTWYSTQNPNSPFVSLGSWADGKGYTQFGSKNGITYFDMGKVYNILEKAGFNNLLLDTNKQFMSNQIDQAKTFILTKIGPDYGISTLREIGWIIESKLYNPTFTNVFTPK